MKRMKQILAGFLVVAMLVAGLMITPMDAKAAEDTVEYNGAEYILDTTDYNFTNYWNADADERTAPTKDGKVFGGWYKNEEGSMKPITEEAAKDIQNGTGVYAKFVPAEVLSIRAQLQVETETGNRGENDMSYLRLLSGVNGLDYQKVGFDILYNKRTQDSEANQKTAKNITKVFSKITNDETDADGMVASELFGKAATHFSVLRLDQIKSKNYELVIYVTPQWTTLDGTLVKGQAKYVRVMDGYADNRYISVPVNFLTGSAVAAGQLDMAYDTRLEVVEVDTNGYDACVQKTEGSYHDNKEGTIKFVNNITGTANIEPESVVYANVWFKVKDGETIASRTELEFKVSGYNFCNWDEQMVEDLSAWDVKYLKQDFSK